MIGKSDGTVQTFDNLNRMVSYKSDEGVTTAYSYYPNDMRRSKKTGTSDETMHIWIDDEIAMDMNGYKIVSSYIYGVNLIKSAYGWYLYNSHGDVTALTDSSGNIVRNYDYNAFGVQKTNIDAVDQNPYRYCGEYYDTESGYTYLRARYYDADTGRFVSEDSANDGNNWYVYCGNDPVNMADPTGMWGAKIHQEITKKAYSGITRLSFILKTLDTPLMKGCIYPDQKLRGENNKKWHGHDGYAKIMKNQSDLAVRTYKKGNIITAFFELGKGLHTLQDFYAHNVVLKNKIVTSRKVANGEIKIERTHKIGGIHPQYFDEKFFDNYEKFERKKIYAGTTLHSITADNPYAYFDTKKEKWIYTHTKSQRYKDAIKESKKYVNNFISGISKKTKNKK